jgi:hypothetical protein
VSSHVQTPPSESRSAVGSAAEAGKSMAIAQLTLIHFAVTN